MFITLSGPLMIESQETHLIPRIHPSTWATVRSGKKLRGHPLKELSKKTLPLQEYTFKIP
jgi:hypothetical protein